ncbi:MAG: hypothetical protein R3A48_00830 [Polyangiales bacterium]
MDPSEPLEETIPELPPAVSPPPGFAGWSLVERALAVCVALCGALACDQLVRLLRRI